MHRVSASTSSSSTGPVRIHLCDESFSFRVSFADAYVMPVRSQPSHQADKAGSDATDTDGSGACPDDCYPRATVVSAYAPMKVDTPETATQPRDRSSGHVKQGSDEAPSPSTALTRSPLAWRCPICGTLETEHLYWVAQGLRSSSSVPSLTAGEATSVTDRRTAKLLARKRAKAQMQRRALVVSSTCTWCHLCPRCGGGGGLGSGARASPSREAQVSSQGIPTAGLQTRVNRAMHYTAECAYCQWSSYRSFSEMQDLVQYLQAMSPSQAPVLRAWRRSQRDMWTRLTAHPRFFEEGTLAAPATTSLSYSRQAWEQLLRLGRERRRAAASEIQSSAATDTLAHESGDVYAEAVRQAGSTHRAVVLEALRGACQRVHEATYYNPKPSSEGVCGAHLPDAGRPSYAAFTPIAVIGEAVQARLLSRSAPLLGSSTVHSATSIEESPEAALVARTQQAQHGLHREFIIRPGMTAESVAALLRPAAGLVEETPVRSDASPALASGAAVFSRPVLVTPSRTGKPASHSPQASSPLVSSHPESASTPTPGRLHVAGETPSRLDALPPHLASFLEEQASLESQYAARPPHNVASLSTPDRTERASPTSDRPWIPTLLAYFVGSPHKTPVTALSVESTVQATGVPALSATATNALTASCPSQVAVKDAALRLVFLLGVSLSAQPDTATVVERWSALLSARFGTTPRTGSLPPQDREDGEGHSGSDEDGDTASSAAPPPLTAQAMALTSSSRARRALPLMVPLRRVALCLLPHLRYLNTTCAYASSSLSAGRSPLSGGRRVVHQMHFQFSNYGMSDVLIERITLVRCGGFPEGSCVGLWTTADTAAHDPEADTQAEELCSHLIDEVQLDKAGAWTRTAAVTGASVPSRQPPRDGAAQSLSGWCRLIPRHAMEKADEPVAGCRRGVAASALQRLRGSALTEAHTSTPPPLSTAAPRLASLPLAFSLSTPMPADGSLTVFATATSGPPPCSLGIRVEAVVHLPEPAVPPAVASVWRTHVPEADRQRVSGYHRVSFGLSISV